MKKRTTPSRSDRSEQLLRQLSKKFEAFELSTHRSFRQLRETVTVGFGNLDAQLSATYFEIKEIKDELGDIHETVNSTYNKMDAFVGKSEQNEIEIQSMGATVNRLEDEEPPSPPDTP